MISDKCNLCGWVGDQHDLIKDNLTKKLHCPICNSDDTDSIGFNPYDDNNDDDDDGGGTDRLIPIIGGIGPIISYN